MKHYLFTATLLAMAAGMLTSCSQDAEPTAQELAHKGHVRLSCSLPTVTTTPMAAPDTRAELTANGSALTDIYILDYDKATGTLLQVLHQTSTATDFAEPDLTMDYGTHTLRIIATRSATPTLITSADTWTVTDNVLTAITGTIPETLTTEKTSDTFATETDVTVSAGTAQDVNVTLDRIVAKLMLNTTDTYPADCNTLDVTMDEYRSIRLDALSVIGCAKTHRVSDVTKNAGQTGRTTAYFLMVPDGGYSTDITITPTRLDGDDYPSVTIKDVPLERNKVTTVTGSIYGHAQGVKVAVNDTWNNEGHELNF